MTMNTTPIDALADTPMPEPPRLRPFPPINLAGPMPGERNVDSAFDVIMEPKGGGGAPAEAAGSFIISDATEAGVEKIVVSPGYVEVINGGFSTFITPTLGGDPITDQTPINAVSGSVYVAVTLSGGAPVSAAIGNAATLPTDTATIKYIQLGTITVGTSVVTVDTQDVNSNVLYHVRKLGSPWRVALSDPNPAAPTAEVTAATLVENLLTGAEITVTGLTGLALTSTTKVWLTGAFNATGGYTGWSITTTDPAGNRIVWGGSPNFYQEEAWYLIGQVVSGSHPELPGFDFKIGEDDYHLEQIANAPLFMARGPLNGRLVWYPTPL